MPRPVSLALAASRRRSRRLLRRHRNLLPRPQRRPQVPVLPPGSSLTLHGFRRDPLLTIPPDLSSPTADAQA
ncbi:MAG: hypothetical protein QJR03_01850 [Sphaerobacter sp.]|nr:hypothetical protein [Sphaerobacter sp.]